MAIPEGVLPDSGKPKPIPGVCGSDEILGSYHQYLGDESRLGGGYADKIVFPEREEQVSLILLQAQARCEPVTVSGGRTGIVGGAVPAGGTLMSLERMDRVIGLRNDGGDWSVRVQPGVTLKGLRKALDASLRGYLDETEWGEVLSIFRQGRFFYPVDPTEDTAHIGGTIATNASGSRSLLYGVTREYVKSLRVVLPTGESLVIPRGKYHADRGVLRILRNGEEVRIPVPIHKMPLVKNTAGFYSWPDMDLIDLFIGSEGTLGVITEVELTLVPKPESLFTGLVFFGSESDAIEFVKRARGEAVGGFHRSKEVLPMCLEYFDSKSLRLLEQHAKETPSPGYPAFPDGSEAAVLFEQGHRSEDLELVYAGWEAIIEASGSDTDRTWGGFDETSSEPIRRVRHTLPEVVNSIIGRNRQACPEIRKVGTDMAVGDEHLNQFVDLHRTLLEKSKMEYVLFGHIGQNHLHANLLPRSLGELDAAEEVVAELAGAVVGMGGSPLVEHGGGRLKRAFIRMIYDREEIHRMETIKRVLDPKLILNRGVLLDL